MSPPRRYLTALRLRACSDWEPVQTRRTIHTGPCPVSLPPYSVRDECLRIGQGTFRAGALQLLTYCCGWRRFTQVPERVTTKSFVVLIIGTQDWITSAHRAPLTSNHGLFLLRRCFVYGRRCPGASRTSLRHPSRTAVSRFIQMCANFSIYVWGGYI